MNEVRSAHRVLYHVTAGAGRLSPGGLRILTSLASALLHSSELCSDFTFLTFQI